MKQLNELKSIRMGSLKWPKRILYIVIGFFLLRGCTTSCNKIFTSEETTKVVEKDSLREFPFGTYSGPYREIVKVGLEEIDKYTKYDSRIAPIYAAMIWYTEGEILDLYRNISINDEVIDTLDWNKFKTDSSYKRLIIEEIIIK